MFIVETLSASSSTVAIVVTITIFIVSFIALIAQGYHEISGIIIPFLISAITGLCGALIVVALYSQFGMSEETFNNPYSIQEEGEHLVNIDKSAVNVYLAEELEVDSITVRIEESYGGYDNPTDAIINGQNIRFTGVDDGEEFEGYFYFVRPDTMKVFITDEGEQKDSMSITLLNE